MTFKKGQPPGPGRPAGAANKITMEARAAFNDLVTNNTSQLQTWLDKVAKKDPAKALHLFLSLAEFCLPKLNRTEHTGEGGGPIETRHLSEMTEEQIVERIAAIHRAAIAGGVAGEEESASIVN